MRRRWTDAEVEALVREYPRHGARWSGWEETIPGRSPMAIAEKASKLGVGVFPDVAGALRSRARRPRRVDTGRWTPDMDRILYASMIVLAKAVKRPVSECAVRILELEDARMGAENGLKTERLEDGGQQQPEQQVAGRIRRRQPGAGGDKN